MKKLKTTEDLFGIDGNYLKPNSIIGHCASRLHPGYISKAQMRKHECLTKNDGKRCSKFTPVYTSKYNYWDEVEKHGDPTERNVLNKKRFK